MQKNNYRNKIIFLKSAASLTQLPPDLSKEVAFLGYSNVGKSSAINVIAGTKNLARAGKTPGVTQLINVFQIRNDCRIIDLPGFGFAKVPLNVRLMWQELINDYLEMRKSLNGIFLLIDIKNPMREMEIDILQWASRFHIPVRVLLTKADKLKSTMANVLLEKIEEEVHKYNSDVKVQLFSSKNKQGVSEVYAQLDEWFFS